MGKWNSGHGCHRGRGAFGDRSSVDSAILFTGYDLNDPLRTVQRGEVYFASDPRASFFVVEPWNTTSGLALRPPIQWLASRLPTLLRSGWRARQWLSKPNWLLIATMDHSARPFLR